MVTVMYKKGDVTNLENYRPICGLPQLNKLSSTMLYPTRQHSEKTFQTTDHFMTYRLISQKSSEWDGHVVGSDRLQEGIQHAAIWRILRNRSVSEQYICLLTTLYTDQPGTVLTDVESDEFGIAREQNKATLLSSLFFNSVLQSAMEKTLKLGKKRACASN